MASNAARSELGGRLTPGARGACVVFWNHKDLKQRKQAAWNFLFRVQFKVQSLHPNHLAPLRGLEG